MNLVKISSINIWDEEWESGYWDRSTGNKGSLGGYYRSKNYVPCLPNTTYYMVLPSNRAQNNTSVAVLFYDGNKNYLSNSVFLNDNTRTFSTLSTVGYVTFFVESNGDDTYHNDIQICLNSEAEKTIYHPHWVLGLNNGNAITCDISQMLPSEVLVVDLGDLNWVKYNATGNTRNYYYLPLGSLLPNCGATGGVNVVSTNIICTKYTPITRSKVYYDTSVDGIDVEATGYVFIGDESFSGDATAFKNYVKGVKLFYKKATS